MKKLLLLAVVIAGVVLVFKYGGFAGKDDPLAQLEQRLSAAESAYQSAARAAGVAGIDTTADAEAALQQIGSVEHDLREMSRGATSEETKHRIAGLLERAAAVRRKIG